MITYTFNDGTTTYTRITKTQASAMFDFNELFYIIARKCRPGFPFSMGFTIYPNQEYHLRSFNQMVANFRYYNCSHETGYYPAFYRMTENKPKTETL